MTQANYSPLIVSLFLDDPREYNSAVVILIRKLRTKLSTEELESVLETARSKLRDIKVELEWEFEHLLLENDIGEGLRQGKTMDVAGAACELILLGIRPPTFDNNDFWLWFDELPQTIQQKVWEKAGYLLYPPGTNSRFNQAWVPKKRG